MSYEHLIWEQDGGVGRLTLNRPDTLNAWTADFGRELKQVVQGEAADSSVRAVMVTGAGRGFSSGADLKEGFDPAEDGMPDVRKELDQLYHPIIAGVRRLEKPVVAAVNGPAVGIGASFAFACDLVLAAESAFFGLAFVNIGLMPDGGSTLFVPTAVGKARALQMALLGERVEAQRALDWGLVNFVYPDDRLLDEANALVERLAQGPTLLLRVLEESAQQDALPRPGRPAATSRPSCSTPSRARATSRRAWWRSWRSARRSSRAHEAADERRMSRPLLAATGASATGASSTGASAIGSRAVGAIAAGAAAIGALALGRLAVKRAVIGHLRIEELEVGRLRVGRLEVEGGPEGHTSEAPLGPPD